MLSVLNLTRIILKIIIYMYMYVQQNQYLLSQLRMPKNSVYLLVKGGQLVLSHAYGKIWLQKGYKGDGERWLVHQISKDVIALQATGGQSGRFLSHAHKKLWLQYGNKGQGEHWKVVEYDNAFFFEARGGEQGLVLSHACNEIGLQKGCNGEPELFYFITI